MIMKALLLLLVCTGSSVFGFPSAGSVDLHRVAGEQYWWKFPKSDCAYDDVSPQPSCGKANKGNVEKLQACCSGTAG